MIDHTRINQVIMKLTEGRNLVDMYATDLPELADWSREVDELLEEKS